MAFRAGNQVSERATRRKTADARFAEQLTDIAIAASAAILAIDFRDAGTHHKADHSPVTRADEVAQAVIQAGLAQAAPATPVVSEEALEQWKGQLPAEFLLVDPLDGTVEFLAGRREYTVNIALVRAATPVVGVVAAPALGILWRGATDHGAERLRFSVEDKPDRKRRASPIRTRVWPKGERVAAVSRSHFDAVSASFLQRVAPVKEVSFGSALKFARLAEGAVDVYPRLAPTSEWDVAAGHAVVVAAGGAVVASDGGPLNYGRWHVGFRVEGFTAWGDRDAAARFTP